MSYSKPKTDPDTIRRNPPANLNLCEAAIYLTVSPKTVQREIKQRKLRPARLGKRLVFTRAELDRFLQVKMGIAAA